jgi:hypothetical protein
MANATEKRIVERALNRLTGDGYRVVLASDGETRHRVGTPLAALEAADGTDMAVFFLEKPGHHCSLFVTWGEGADVICDLSADSEAELERIDPLVWP